MEYNSNYAIKTKIQKQWFDWVEVDWDDNNGNVYTVPTTLDLLYGVVRYCILTKALICLHQ
jgi:hypothetical protein